MKLVRVGARIHVQHNWQVKPLFFSKNSRQRNRLLKEIRSATGRVIHRQLGRGKQEPSVPETYCCKANWSDDPTICLSESAA